MQFKDAKQGYPIYIVDRKDVSVKSGKVVNTPIPHFDNQFGSTAKMVVDISADIGGKVSSYVLDECSEIGYVGDIAVTISRECVVREIESVKSRSEDALSMVDYRRVAVGKCDDILKEYSQEYKDRVAYNNRLNEMDSKIDRLTDAITRLVGSGLHRQDVT